MLKDFGQKVHVNYPNGLKRPYTIVGGQGGNRTRGPEISSRRALPLGYLALRLGVALRIRELARLNNRAALLGLCSEPPKFSGRPAVPTAGGPFISGRTWLELRRVQNPSDYPQSPAGFPQVAP